MSYTELISTMTISSDVPTNVNENFRTAHFLNDAAKTASFTVWEDDTAGVPFDVYLCASAGGMSPSLFLIAPMSTAMLTSEGL